jgi:hypothetical protein
MPTKSDKDKPTKEDTKGHATNAEGEILPPGSTVPAYQDPDLAEKGIYQPADQAANAPAIPKDEEETGSQAEHRKNLRNLPPVPAERAGAASQAK